MLRTIMLTRMTGTHREEAQAYYSALMFRTGSYVARLSASEQCHNVSHAPDSAVRVPPVLLQDAELAGTQEPCRPDTSREHDRGVRAQLNSLVQRRDDWYHVRVPSKHSRDLCDDLVCSLHVRRVCVPLRRGYPMPRIIIPVTMRQIWLITCLQCSLHNDDAYPF